MSAALESSISPDFENLYQEYHRPLLTHLTWLVHDRSVAEDLCHDSFIKALRHWDDHHADASLRAWLYRIATNTAYDYLRRKQRIHFAPLADVEPSAYTAESALDEREPVLLALAKLPPAYRLPLVMHSYEGRSTHEIAAALGCSPNAVKTRLFRARERFRAVYQA